MRLRTRWMPIESSLVSGMVKRFQNSFWNCVSMLLTASTRIRRPRPRAISSLTRMPASSVFPSPTASAIQDALPRLAQRLPGRLELVGRRVHRRPVGDVDARSSFGTAWRSRLSRYSRLSAKPGDGSGTRQVSAGSSTWISGSRVVRKIASRSRTSSETPSHTSWYPPSGERSTRADHPLGVADHDARAGGQRRACNGAHAGDPPTGSSGAVASGSVLTTPSSSG